MTIRLWRLFAISDDNAGMLLLAEQSTSNISAYQLSYLPVWRQLKNCAVIVVFNHSGEFSIPATCCRVSHLVPFENLIIVKELIWTRCRFFFRFCVQTLTLCGLCWTRVITIHMEDIFNQLPARSLSFFECIVCLTILIWKISLFFSQSL